MSAGRADRRHAVDADREAQGRAPAEPSAEGEAAAVQQLRALQRSAGNAAVARSVMRTSGGRRLSRDPDFQLTEPTLMPPRKGPNLLPGKLELDPLLGLKLLELDLHPQSLRELFAQIDPSQFTVPAPGPPPPSPTPPKPAPHTPGAFDVDHPEPGSPGDVLTALTKVPVIEQLGEQAKYELWTKLPSAEKWTLGISGVTIALTAVGGMLATPGGRQALAGLGGKPLSIPGFPYLAPEFNVDGGNLVLGLHVDVGAFLDGKLGFGTAARAAKALTPQPPGL